MSGRCQGGVAFALGVLFVCVSGMQAAQTAPAGTAVPEVAIEAIEAQFSPTEQPASRAEADSILVKHMEKAIELGQDAEAMYPDAPNLYVVRQMMLIAAMELAAQQPTPERQQQVVQIAQRIMDSSAPAVEKLQADFFLLREKALQARYTPADQPRPDMTDDVRAFLSRYETTPALPRSVAYGVVLADLAQLGRLKEELLNRLEKDFSSIEELKPFLEHYGRGTPKPSPSPSSSKTFSARLPLLDGKTLEVPQGVKAKVIVIDFWATWCGPCVASMPHMKQVYQQFHNRGVEFVGISLDKEPGARERVQKFVKENGLTWVHAVSGQGWQDPTARKYGINAIPSVWVINSQGRVISDKARGNLEKVLEEALSRQAASPSAGPTTQPAR